MEQTLMEQPGSASMEAPPAPVKRFKRAGKRKTGFRMDTPPYPVRAIWELAPETERHEAHKMGVLMLEHWLGRMTRKQLGEKLDLPALRVWQLSQQALAGMVVGLMAQPKRPPKGTPMPGETKISEKDELKQLRKENHNLREDNRVLKELLEVLKDMPAQAAEPKALPGKKIKQSKTHANFLSQDRSLAPAAKPKEG
jgi:hypothetical protein